MRHLFGAGTILAAVLILCVSCGDDKTTTPAGDEIAPAAITDLQITDSLGTELQLQWTATGDDDTLGTAASYLVRISTEPLTDENWELAEVVPNAPTPTLSGTTQTLSVGKVAWWTRYYVGLRASDEEGNWSPISNVVAATPYTDTDYHLLIDTDDGMMQVDLEGTVSTFLEWARWVEVLGDRVYSGASAIFEFDFDGNQTRRISLPSGLNHYGLGALPGGRFALISNRFDTVYIVDDAENVLARVALSEEPGSSLQSTFAQVVGNRVLISEDGQGHVVAIDLDSYELSIFADLSDKSGWLGAIDYADGYYCVCQSQDIWHFREGFPPELVTTVPEGNIGGAVMLGGYTFVTINFTGELLRVNNETGEITVFVDGLNRPGDMEVIAL